MKFFFGKNIENVLEEEKNRIYSYESSIGDELLNQIHICFNIGIPGGMLSDLYIQICE